MLICSSCGKENPDGFTFCGFCSGSLVPTAADARKTVTILFCDLSDSTVAGERLDPEVLSRVIARFMAEMSAAVERHGGTVAKFVGDAVMAVFGIPHVHEDDALRAVRAAAEMREALETLSHEVERDLGVSMRPRVGVNTGEVLVAAGNADVLGDPANTAARLESAAAPGEVLLGESTYRLVRDAVVAEQMQPLELKGKAEPITTYRLIRVASLSPIRTRRLDAPMVGRSRETRLLQQAFERAVSDRSCQLFTVLGTAGAGKSRLVEEFLGTLDVADVLQGRCLPYGDGITYYPVTEAMKGALGLADFDDETTVNERIHASVGTEEHADAITANLAKLLGAGEGGAPEETFWAVRRFFEIRGREQPLVVVFDDIHWGEETFLDLIEHVADWSRDAQILLLCMARPDLLYERPAWAGGKTNATTISLAPLTEGEITELIDHLLGDAGLPAEVRSRIAAVAEGNPLFVEEMLRMLIDDGLLERDGDGWVPVGDLSAVSVPPTISVLLSARLDRLSSPERQVIERAAVEGKEFHRGAVLDLLPEPSRAAVDVHLKTLTRKELISPERSLLPGQDAYRFRHLLIRDAAYDQIPKQDRADLHMAFADWLEGVAGDRIVEQEEIVGYHLEQAVRYRDELGLPKNGALRLRAGDRLGAAGNRAFDRVDMRAAADLLERAADLSEGGPAQLLLLDRLWQALLECASLDGARRVGDRLRDAARSAGDEVFEVRADVYRYSSMLLASPERWRLEEDEELSERALRVYREHDAVHFIPDGLIVCAFSALSRGDTASMIALLTEGLDLAVNLSERRAISLCVDIMLVGIRHGPTPLTEAHGRASRFLETFATDRYLLGWALLRRALICVDLGRPDEARADADRARAIQDDLGLRWNAPGYSLLEGLVAWQVEGPAAAETPLATANRMMRESGDRLNIGAVGSPLARVLVELGRDAEATEVVGTFRGNLLDPIGTIGAFGIDAVISARAGRFEEAHRLLQEAEVIAAPMDLLPSKAQLALDRADVMRLAARLEEARAAAEDALAMYEQKEHVVGARRVRRFLDVL